MRTISLARTLRGTFAGITPPVLATWFWHPVSSTDSRIVGEQLDPFTAIFPEHPLAFHASDEVTAIIADKLGFVDRTQAGESPLVLGQLVRLARDHLQRQPHPAHDHFIGCRRAFCGLKT